LLLEHISFNTMLIYIGIIVLVISFMLPFIKTNNTVRTEGTGRAKFVMIDREVLPVGTEVLFMGIAYSAVLSFLNLYAIEIDLVTAASMFSWFTLRQFC